PCSSASSARIDGAPESEERFGVTMPAFANRAAAFDKIPFDFELPVLTPQTRQLLTLRRRSDRHRPDPHLDLSVSPVPDRPRRADKIV
ncbi:MAG: hypothetical protein ACREXR_21180, partial [Gammaproteobacteria bacterium]